jgi:uncharacterized protein YgiM (DUF1202 family)
VRVDLAAVLSLGVLLSEPALGEQTFPYTGYVTAENVYVRSGPGRNYYPTSKLGTGDKVEIYRHDPGGWYAIRPVEGSFSWVSGRYLQVAEDGLAKVSGDRVAARVGSQFSDIRDVIQVRLHEGELVEVLDEKHLGSGSESGPWYKIAPPPGEFRWVFGKFVDPNYHQSGVRKAPAEYHPLVGSGQPAADRVAAAGGQTPDAGSDQPDADGQASSAPSASDVRTADHWSAPSGANPQGPQQEPPGAAAVASTDRDRRETDAEVGHTNRFVEPAHDPAGSVTSRRLSPEEFQAELGEIDVELSIMLAEEPTVWKLDELALRAQSLLAEAETAVERGRVRLLANKIARSEDLKRRYDAVNGTQMATERRNRQLSELSQARQSTPAEPAPGNRFDGVGRLARVLPPKLGAPRFALVDQNGDVRCYVTPAPGLNLNYYVGRHVGVNGNRGYIADKRIQHVTAKHVTPLTATRIR